MKTFFIFLLSFIAFRAIAQTPPVAVSDTFIVPQNSNNILPVTQNDTNYAGGLLAVQMITAPANGTASVINGNQINYVPNTLYFGRDSFTYSICDINSLCDTASVFIVIIGSNAPPRAWEDEMVIAEDSDTTELKVLDNDTDPEGDVLYVRSVFTQGFNTALGQIFFDSTKGKIIFIREPFACGKASFRYLVCDLSGCDTGQATIYIYCPGDVFLPEGFSPNGDGKNDLLVFTGLEYFAPASLKVFNRYGNIVYDANDYKNDWNGTTSAGGRPLPDGTYYYILELIDKRKYSNYLVIQR